MYVMQGMGNLRFPTVADALAPRFHSRTQFQYLALYCPSRPTIDHTIEALTTKVAKVNWLLLAVA